MSLAPPEFGESKLAGIDFSWLAVDGDGHIAWLVTFGSAVVPSWVEEHSDDFARAEDAVEALPERGGCKLVADETAGVITQWAAAARRGLFAYDWEVYSGPYRLLAAPEKPIEVADLPREISELASRSRFSGICFRSQPTLGVSDVLACRGPTNP